MRRIWCYVDGRQHRAVVTECYRICSDRVFPERLFSKLEIFVLFDTFRLVHLIILRQVNFYFFEFRTHLHFEKVVGIVVELLADVERILGGVSAAVEQLKLAFI